MQITLLGTGTSQGVPVIGCGCEVCQSSHQKDKRLRSSVLLEWDDYKYVIDCGPDFRAQMLRENIERINGILFSHEHADHSAGMDDIRPFYFKMKQAVPIYALPGVLKDLEKRFEYIFTEKNRYPGAPKVEKHILLPYKNFRLGNKDFVPLNIIHGNLPILGFKTSGFAYITDAKIVPEETRQHLFGIDTIVVNALHHNTHKMHMNLEETLDFIEKIKPGKAILTHISHHMGKYTDIQPQLPNHVVLGYDGLKISVDY